MRIVIWILFFVVLACRPTKTHTHKADSVAVNTNYVKVDSTYISPPSAGVINLPNPCDSLGRLIGVYMAFKNGNTTTTIDTRKGAVKVSTYHAGSVHKTLKENQTNNTTQKSQSTTSQTKEVVVWPEWLIWWAILATILALIGWVIVFKKIK